MSVPEPVYDIEDTEKRMVNGEYRDYMDIRKDGEVYAGSDIRDLIFNKVPDDKYVVGFKEDTSENSKGGLLPVTIPVDATTHTHGSISGTTGAGKSNLIQNNIIQKIDKGHGALFCDAKKGKYDEPFDSIDDIDIDGVENPDIGEDSLKLIKKIPEHRIDDVVYINSKPIGGNSIDFNPLNLPDFVDDNRSTKDELAHTYKEVVKNIIKSIGEDDMFGARMQQIFDDVVIGMIKSERNYSIADLHYMLTVENDDEDAKENVINAISRFAMMEDFDDEWLTESIKTVSDIDDTKALERRTDRLIGTSDSIRGFLANPVNDIDLSDILEENKIVILDIQVSEDGIKQAIVSYIMESLRLLSEGIRMDKEFYCYIDEFQNVYPDKTEPVVEYNTLLQQGRSNNFLLVYGTQSPDSLSNFLEQQVFDNTNTSITGPLKGNSINKIKPLFRTQDSRRVNNKKQKPENAILSLDKNNYEFLVRTPKGNVTKIQSIPALPPVRTTEEAVKIVHKSCSSEMYGSPHSYRDEIEEIVQDLIIADKEDTLTSNEEIQIVDTAINYNNQINNEHNKTTPKSTIEKIINNAVEIDSTDYTLSERLEKLENSGYLESETINDERLYSITETGREEKLNISTGSAGSGGKSEHRSGLSKIRNQLAEYGIYVKLPSQGGADDIADGVARKFDDENTPNPFNVDIGEMFRIEYEKSTTQDKPYKMQKNLAKADSDELVVFASERPDTCDKVNSIINDKGYQNPDGSKGKKLYNMDSQYHLSDNGVMPLRKIIAPDVSGSKTNRWYISDDEVSLYEKTKDGKLRESIKLPVDLEWEKEDFPAYAVKGSDGWRIYENGNKKHSLKNKKQIKKKTNYKKVIPPWIPDKEFEGGDLDNHRYEIMLVDTPSKITDEPQLLVNGEYIALSDVNNKNEENDNNNKDEQNEKSENTEENDVDELLGI